MFSPLYFIDADIEFKTRGQSKNPEWFRQRANKLTASRFYDVVHAVPRQHSINNSHSHNMAACKFGLDSELPAFELYKAKHEHLVRYHFQPGLCVSLVYPNLAASPDFIVYADPKPAELKFPDHAYIVEIKSFMDNPLADDIYALARLKKQYFCCDVTPKGHLEIRKDHRFYYQIIGQLNILFCENPLAYCHLVLYYKGQISVVQINNDIDLWRTISPKLCVLKK